MPRHLLLRGTRTGHERVRTGELALGKLQERRVEVDLRPRRSAVTCQNRAKRTNKFETSSAPQSPISIFGLFEENCLQTSSEEVWSAQHFPRIVRDRSEPRDLVFFLVM